MDAMRMLTMSFGGITAQAVGVAAQLGIVDHLANGPRTAGDLAGAPGAHAPAPPPLPPSPPPPGQRGGAAGGPGGPLPAAAPRRHAPLRRPRFGARAGRHD